MRGVIGVVGLKGGTGKTTTAVSLVSGLWDLGHAITLIDADPQGAAARWIASYADGRRLTVIHAGTVPEIRSAIDGVDGGMAIIDGPPFDFGRNNFILSVSDLAVVPLRPSPIDVEAAASFIEGTRCPVLLVLTQRIRQDRILADARRAAGRFAPIAATEVCYRPEYINAFASRKLVPSLDPGGKVSSEVMLLTSEVLDAFYRIQRLRQSLSERSLP